MNKSNLLSKAEMKKVMGGTPSEDMMRCYVNHGSGQECVDCCGRVSEHAGMCEQVCNGQYTT